MKNKWIVLLVLVIVIVLLFFFCINRAKNRTNYGTNNGTSQGNNSSNGNGNNNSNNNGDSNSVVEPTEDEGSIGAITYGEWGEDNAVYTNEYLGLRVILPPGWVANSDSKIAEMNGMKVEELRDDKLLAKKLNVFLVIADDDEKGDNLQLKSFRSSATIEEHLTEMKTQLESLTYMHYEVERKEDVVVGDRTFSQLVMKLTTDETVSYQRYYATKIDDNIITLSLYSSTDDITINDFLSAIQNETPSNE